jgi:hypothetical protein
MSEVGDPVDPAWPSADLSYQASDRSPAARITLDRVRLPSGDLDGLQDGSAVAFVISEPCREPDTYLDERLAVPVREVDRVEVGRALVSRWPSSSSGDGDGAT